jgi:hypothetical protein
VSCNPLANVTLPGSSMPTNQNRTVLYVSRTEKTKKRELKVKTRIFAK